MEAKNHNQSIKTMDRCPDCGNRHLVDNHGELTCTNCGLVCDADRLVHNPVFCDHVEVLCNMTSDDVATKLKIEEICSTYNLPVASTAYEIFSRFTEDRIIKGHHRDMTMLAAIYFAQSVLNHGAKSKAELSMDRGFLSACNEVFTFLVNTPSLSYLVTEKPKHRIEDSLGRLMGNVLLIDNEHQPRVRALTIKVGRNGFNT